MRVLAAHPVADRYGADLMLRASLRAMCARGHEVSLVVAEDGPLLQDCAADGVEVDVAEFPVLRKALLRPRGLASLVLGTPGALLRLRRRIRDADPDVVYVNTLTLPHWIAAARLAGVPVVCHVREAEQDPPELVTRALTMPLLACDRLVTNSAFTAAHLVSRWRRLASRVEVVHNGFEFGETPTGRPPQPDGTILLVGRLNPRKGQDTAIEALAMLRARGMACRLTLVGTAFDGYEWYVRELHETAARLGVHDSVDFAGYRPDIAACNAGADIVVVPSRVEPFGNVAVEALAANRPLIASAVGGLQEIVEHGTTGLLVAPGDADALADAVESLLADPEGAQAMAQHGARMVRERFQLARYEDDIARILESAGQRQGRPDA